MDKVFEIIRALRVTDETLVSFFSQLQEKLAADRWQIKVRLLSQEECKSIEQKMAEKAIKHNIFYYPYALFTNSELPLLKVAPLDKDYLLIKVIL